MTCLIKYTTKLKSITFDKNDTTIFYLKIIYVAQVKCYNFRELTLCLKVKKKM